MVTVLRVAMNGLHVGELTKKNGEWVFAYAREWLGHPQCRGLSLSLPAFAGRHVGDGLKDWIENLLPDNTQIRQRLGRILAVNPADTFALLGALGRDCAGAVELYPEGGTPPSPLRESKPLGESDIETLLSNLPDKPLGITRDSDFRISLAGAQRKTALLAGQGGWARPLHATPTTHILKAPIGMLSGGRFDLSESCENEWLCLAIARSLGLPAAKARLGKFGKERALIVERFDRRAADDGVIVRLPTKDMCQALGVPADRKYQSDGGPGIREIMELLRHSETPQTDRRHFLAMQVLLWLLNSTDGHAKNYSIFLGAGGSFCLAPFYDILSAEPLIAAGSFEPKRARLAMPLLVKNRHSEMETIAVRHFLSTAGAVGFDTNEMTDILRDFADRAETVAEAVRTELPPDFPKTTAEPIFDVFLRRARKIHAWLSEQA